MATIVGVLVALLAVLYFVYLPNHKPDSVGQLTGNEQAAMAAAGTEAANLATYTRANFEKDFARTLAGTTGKFTADVKALKAKTLSTLTSGKFDISAKVRHVALVGPAESGKKNSYVVLVVLFGYQSTNPSIPNPQNLQVTVNKVDSKWKVSNVTSVTIS